MKKKPKKSPFYTDKELRKIFREKLISSYSYQIRAFFHSNKDTYSWEDVLEEEFLQTVLDPPPVDSRLDNLEFGLMQGKVKQKWERFLSKHSKSEWVATNLVEKLKEYGVEDIDFCDGKVRISFNGKLK